MGERLSPVTMPDRLYFVAGGVVGVGAEGE
jgi:hypothetical protein